LVVLVAVAVVLEVKHDWLYSAPLEEEAVHLSLVKMADLFN
jgi:hypothetical protein